MNACKICSEKHEGLGYCRKHYRSFKKYGTPFFPKRKYPQKRKCKLCEEIARCKELCDNHYRKFLRYGILTTHDKRSDKSNYLKKMMEIVSSIPIDKNGCKIWPMGINSSGYGHFSIKNKSYNVSRLLYKTINPGEYKGLVVRHKCDNRACCNIDHLEIGTQKDNIHDIKKRNRGLFGKYN